MDNATVTAALIAAVVSFVSMIVTIRTSRQQQAHQDRQAAFEHEIKKQSLAFEERRATFENDLRRHALVSEERRAAFEDDLRRQALVSEEARAMRLSLLALAELGEGVKNSVRRLLALSPTINDEHMMLETASTLAIIASFFTATGQKLQAQAPREVVDLVLALQKQMASFFLQLEMRRERREESTERLSNSYEELQNLLQSLQFSIRKHVAPQLQPE
jgi:hypothetical protein